VNKNNFVKSFVLSLIIVFSGLQARVPLGAVHGTYDYVAEEYKRISPLVGVIWWHVGIVRNIYTLGDEDKGSFRGLTKLARKLFYELTGHFASTQSPRLIAYHISPAGVGKVIEKIEGEINAGKKSLDKTFKKELFGLILDDIIWWADTRIERAKESIKKLDARLKELKSFLKDPAYLKIFERADRAEREQSPTKIDQRKKMIKILKKAKRRFNNVKTYSDEKCQKGKQCRTDKKNLNEFIEAIAMAYEESGYFDTKKSPMRPFKYGLHALFSAFMYDKFDSKKSFQEYFGEFDDKFFVEDGKAKIDNPSWLEHFYRRADVEIIEKNFIENNKSKKLPVDAEISIDLLGDVSLEAYAYAQIMNKDFLVVFPDQVSYQDAFYKNNKFPDCFESTKRSLSNSTLFNPDDFEFKASKDDIEKFKWNLDDEFKKFYKKYPSVGSKGLQYAHNDWTNVVENRVFCSYSNIRVKGKSSPAPEEIEGFVPVKNLKREIEALKSKIDFSPKALGAGNFYEIQAPDEKKYLLFDVDSPDIIAYEVMPRVRNLVTLINKLFGLKLFQETIEEVLLKKDFNGEHIDDAFKRIGFSSVSYESSKIDSLDGKEKIIMVVEKEKSTFKIEISSGHAKAEVDNEKQKSDLGIEDKLLNFFDRKGLGLLDDFLLLVLNKPSVKEIFERTWIKAVPTDSFEQLMLFRDLATVDQKTRAVKEILLLKKINDEQKKVVESLWIKIINTLPILDGQVHEEIVGSLSNLRDFHDLITNEENFEKNKKSESYFLILLFHLKRYSTPSSQPDIAEKLLEESVKSKNPVILDVSKNVIVIFLMARHKQTDNFFTKKITEFFKEDLVKVKSDDIERKIIFPLSLLSRLGKGGVKKTRTIRGLYRKKIRKYFGPIITKTFEALKIVNESDKIKVIVALMDALNVFMEFTRPTDEEWSNLLALLKSVSKPPGIEIKEKVLSLLNSLIKQKRIKKNDAENIKFAFDLVLSGIETGDESIFKLSLLVFEGLVFLDLVKSKDDIRKFLKLATKNLMTGRISLASVGFKVSRYIRELVEENKFTIQEFLTDEFAKIGSLYWIVKLPVEEEKILKEIFNFVFESGYEKVKNWKKVFMLIKYKFLRNPPAGQALVKKNKQKIFDFLVMAKIDGYYGIEELRELLRDYDLKKTEKNVAASIKFVADVLVDIRYFLMDLPRKLIEKKWLTLENVGPIFTKVLRDIYEKAYGMSRSEHEVRILNKYFKLLVEENLVNKDNIVGLSKSLDEEIREKLPEIISKVGLDEEKVNELQNPLKKK
jgi:hypothetical protein